MIDGKDVVYAQSGKFKVQYRESTSLYVDFMLNKISRDSFLEHITLLNEVERDKLFGMSKMQIFRNIYEDMVAQNKESARLSESA
mgnify:FL=1|tara:strand:+ start:1523 stop:1777 length:255 start_codon:yes stop_codon:yes gene_type:complete